MLWEGKFISDEQKLEDLIRMAKNNEIRILSIDQVSEDDGVIENISLDVKLMRSIPDLRKRGVGRMTKQINFEEFTNNLANWAKERNLLNKDPHIQFTKIVEELGETSAAYNKQKHTELVDSIGDLLVTIVIFAHQVGIDPQEAYNYAWSQIANRKGKTIDGVFIKEADLKGEENG